MLIVAVLLARYQPNTPTPEANKDLDAEVSFDRYELEIENREPVRWWDCALKINDEYEFQLDSLESHKTAKISALKFSTEKGLRFRPREMVAKTFSASCSTNDGLRFYRGRWHD